MSSTNAKIEAIVAEAAGALGINPLVLAALPIGRLHHFAWNQLRDLEGMRELLDRRVDALEALLAAVRRRNAGDVLGGTSVTDGASNGAPKKGRAACARDC
jgi:hypothetical protein